jgi:antirestriction protein ArdC
MPHPNQIRQHVTNAIVESLKSGNLPPWKQPWRNDPNAGQSRNVVSGKAYRGVNPLLLQTPSMRHGFTSKWWATFNQWKQLGGTVMRRPEDVPPGQWGTTIVFCRPVTVKKSEDGEEIEETFYAMRSYTVFCIDQVWGQDLDHLRVGYATLDAEDVEQRYERADELVDATGAAIRYGGNSAHYDPLRDEIVLPYRHQFALPEFYGTAFHELTHWTEHPSRLNLDRKQPGNTYDFCELVAELGSCFMTAELELPTAENLENSAAYLESWLRSMENDPRFIFQAASLANKAVDYLLSFSRTLVEERELALT